MPLPERWQSRLRTATAMAALSLARLIVATVHLKRWSNSLGRRARDPASEASVAEARRFAEHVEWAARRLPFSAKCLPRAIALSWILGRKKIGHAVVIAVRPANFRNSPDALHAWVEINGQKIIGDVPGPWVETLRLGA